MDKLGLHKIEYYSSLKIGELTSEKDICGSTYCQVKDPRLKVIQGNNPNILHFDNDNTKEGI